MLLDTQKFKLVQDLANKVEAMLGDTEISEAILSVVQRNFPLDRALWPDWQKEIAATIRYRTIARMAVRSLPASVAEETIVAVPHEVVVFANAHPGERIKYETKLVVPNPQQSP